MGKFNKTTEKRKPTAVNKMGERAYKLDPREELVSTLMTTFLSKSYYETEKEIVGRIKRAAAKCDPYFLAQLAIYVRREGKMRSSSHLLAGLLAPLTSGTEWGSRFYKKIVRRPDDISEIISYYLAELARSSSKSKRRKKAITNAMRKGFKAAMENFDAYQIDKYKMSNRDISMIDLVNMLHPKPKGKNYEAYNRLMAGESLDDLYESNITEKVVSAAGSSKKAKAKAYESVMNNPKGMPIMNLLRNLRNLLQDAPHLIEDACGQLTNPEAIRKSMLLPFRFATAYTEIEKLRTSTSRINFESSSKPRAKVDKVLKALNTAIELACYNIPVLPGSTAILIDHSGSMRGDSEGESLASIFSKTNKANIASLMGCMMAFAQNNVYVGLFGQRLVEFKYDRSKGLLQNYKAIMELGRRCGGANEHGIYEFLNAVIQDGDDVTVNNLITFSDMVIGSGGASRWYGSGSVGKYNTGHGSFQALFRDFRRAQPWCNTIAVDITQTDGTSVFDRSMNVTQVAGWSERIFDVIDKATIGYGAIIKEIQKIKI